MHDKRIAAIAALALVATACSSPSSGGSSADGPLTVYSDNSYWEGAFVTVGDKLAETTGRGFEPRAIPLTTNYEQQVRTALPTSSITDIIKWWSGYRLQDIARDGHLTDLTEVWEQAEKNGWVDPRLREAYEYDGKVYGLPAYQSNWVVFYSIPLYEKYKLKPPTTFAEFEHNAQVLEGNGVTPMWSGQSDGWTPLIPFQDLVAKQDPAFYEKLATGKASYTDPTVHEAMTIWKRWIDAGWMTPADSAMSDAAALMRTGKLAHLTAGTWQNGVMKTAKLVPGKDYGAFLLPTVEPGGTQSVFVEGGVLAVPANAPNRDAAVEQLRHWLSPEVQEVWAEQIGDNSPNPDVVPDDAVLASVREQIATADPVLLNRYWEASPPALVEGNVQDLGGFMVHPGDIDGLLSKMQDRARTEWAAWEDEGR
ncbi:ABC transporter substrate-binding protein [Actinophytocola oryzae]|uniref:Carbohydrate ABC transporter substrate-binding protein (CUT1 family) n=1 Tax=Actinophytocola oryzae TaxID=502181 RepID=A0A4R7UTT1_9PSEU|nr:extracellular solute-binding protein [Actinophytocola oryzae]TDV38569.1 carbohydrate ABC transporter substrate-binding protein (CUT1 family) [Actinophytocola oryzae]